MTNFVYRNGLLNRLQSCFGIRIQRERETERDNVQRERRGWLQDQEGSQIGGWRAGCPSPEVACRATTVLRTTFYPLPPLLHYSPSHRGYRFYRIPLQPRREERTLAEAERVEVRLGARYGYLRAWNAVIGRSESVSFRATKPGVEKGNRRPPRASLSQSRESNAADRDSSPPNSAARKIDRSIDRPTDRSISLLREIRLGSEGKEEKGILREEKVSGGKEVRLVSG